MDVEEAPYHVVWAIEELYSSARYRAIVEVKKALEDPFPEGDHEERVEWAKARHHAFYTGTSTLKSANTSLRDVYLGLAKYGLLGTEYSPTATCETRLIMAIIARTHGVPIRPENVFAGLEYCCRDHIAVRTYEEMMRQGHYPAAQEDLERFHLLAHRIAAASGSNKLLRLSRTDGVLSEPPPAA